MTGLRCSALSGGRGQLTAFRDIELTVDSGKVLALLGPNGAGKSTLLMTLAGLLPAMSGSIAVDGVELKTGRPALANRAGIVLVPDNRCLFMTLTVEDNVRVGTRRRGPRPREILDLFPALEKRWNVRAGALSGGEQQMLAIARAIVQQPKVLLIDELSMGLAPLVVRTLFSAVRQIADERSCAVVLVEQHVGLALRAADDAAVLNRGAIALHGPAADLLGNEAALERAYFGDGHPDPGSAVVSSADEPEHVATTGQPAPS